MFETGSSMASKTAWGRCRMRAEREGRVVTVPIGAPEVACLALALDEAGHCVAWAEVPDQQDRRPIIFALQNILLRHCPEAAV